MPDYGLLPEGFVPKTIEIIRAEREERFRLKFGRSFPLGDSSIAGFFIGIESEREALLWEVAEGSAEITDPDKASGAGLRSLCLITGTFEVPASSSIVLETLCGDDGTVVTTGTIVSTSSTGKRFETVGPCTIVGLDAWVATTGYVIDDEVTNSSRCYRCIAAGTSAGSGGPTTTDEDITDGSVHWIYLGEGTATVDTIVACVDTGDVPAVAFDLTVIETPMGGLNSARNLLDAQLGRGAMSDQELRLLREAELARTGTGVPDAIRADLLNEANVPGVESVTVFYNDTDETVDGMPPHSVEAMVEGGTDQKIWTQLLASIVAGIRPWGDQIGTATDSQGTVHVERFTRPESILIYVRISVEEDPDTFPADGVAQIKAAIVAFGLLQLGGKDAVPSSIGAQAFDVTGVDDVVSTFIYTDVIGAPTAWVALTPYVATVGARSVVTNDGGRAYICITAGTSAASGGPTGIGSDITDGTVHWSFLGNTIPVSLRQRAVFDTSRVAVTTAEAIP